MAMVCKVHNLDKYDAPSRAIWRARLSLWFGGIIVCSLAYVTCFWPGIQKWYEQEFGTSWMCPVPFVLMIVAAHAAWGTGLLLLRCFMKTYSDFFFQNLHIFFFWIQPFSQLFLQKLYHWPAMCIKLPSCGSHFEWYGSSSGRWFVGVGFTYFFGSMFIAALSFVYGALIVARFPDLFRKIVWVRSCVMFLGCLILLALQMWVFRPAALALDTPELQDSYNELVIRGWEESANPNLIYFFVHYLTIPEVTIPLYGIIAILAFIFTSSRIFHTEPYSPVISWKPFLDV